jgi:AcrR family transcriptional regulator
MGIQVTEQLKKTKWQQKREASYLALIDSAMRKFHEHGYTPTTIANIVEGTGYTSGAFYYHFKTKADCFWHVLEHRQKQRGDWSRLTDSLDPKTPLREILSRVFAHFEHTNERLDNWLLVMVDFRHQHKDDPNVQERLNAVYHGWHSEIARFVVALQQGGWVATDHDPNTLATQLLAATQGLRAHTLLFQLDPATSQTAIVDMLIKILEQPD